jgi:hypothetical protein
MIKYTGFFLLLVFLSCNNEKTTGDNINGEMETEIVYEKEQVPSFQQNFPGLSQYLQSQDPSFSENRFTTGEVVSRDTMPYHPIAEGSMEPYRSFLVYNADSSFAIDIVSYNFIETKKGGRKRLEFAGPDTEVGLIDVKNNMRRRILFLGSAGLVLDAKWEGNKILIAGAEDAGQEQIRPLMWRFNVQDSALEMFSFPGTIKANVQEYYETKYNRSRTTLSV